jgi:hypothetical protein
MISVARSLGVSLEAMDPIAFDRDVQRLASYLSSLESHGKGIEPNIPLGPEIDGRQVAITARGLEIKQRSGVTNLRRNSLWTFRTPTAADLEPWSGRRLDVPLVSVIRSFNRDRVDQHVQLSATKPFRSLFPNRELDNPLGLMGTYHCPDSADVFEI